MSSPARRSNVVLLTFGAEVYGVVFNEGIDCSQATDEALLCLVERLEAARSILSRNQHDIAGHSLLLGMRYSALRAAGIAMPKIYPRLMLSSEVNAVLALLRGAETDALLAAERFETIV